MCAGMAVLFGPPTVGGACYYVWYSGKAMMLRRLGADEGEGGAKAFFVGVASLVGAYQAQRLLFVRHCDEGGALSLDWKKSADSLGEPLKISTWKQFYRAAGPPVFARCFALVASFYVAGAAHAWVSAPPPKPKRQAAAQTNPNAMRRGGNR